MALFLQHSPVPIEIQQQEEGTVVDKSIVPLKVYTSIPGVNVPGVLVLQFLQIDFTVLHNCIISKTPTDGTTGRLTVP